MSGGQLIPQFLQAKGGSSLAFGPQHRHHFTEDADGTCESSLLHDAPDCSESFLQGRGLVSRHADPWSGGPAPWFRSLLVFDARRLFEWS